MRVAPLCRGMLTFSSRRRVQLPKVARSRTRQRTTRAGPSITPPPPCGCLTQAGVTLAYPGAVESSLCLAAEAMQKVCAAIKQMLEDILAGARPKPFHLNPQDLADLAGEAGLSMPQFSR